MALQDFQHLGHYVTENVLREVGRRGQLTSVQKTDALCVWSMSLGLRRPSEPTLQTLVALKLHIGGGMEEANGQDFFDLFKIFKGHFKKMVQVNNNPALEAVHVLPANPQDFAREFPSTWADFSAVNGNELVEMDERWFLQLASIKAQIPMRKTHSMLDRGDGRSAPAPQLSAAENVLERFMDILGGRAPAGVRHRHMTKSPDPRSKVSQATALFERLQSQMDQQSAPASQAPSAKRPRTEAPPVPSKQEPQVETSKQPASPPAEALQMVAASPLTDQEEVDPAEEAETKPFLEAAESSMAALDAALGVQRKPAIAVEPIKKSMPTPSKAAEEHPPPAVLKRPAQQTQVEAASSVPKKKPSARSAVHKKPSTTPKAALTSLPKAPQWLVREYRGGCGKCRYQAKGCTPSCWRARGYAP